MKRGRINFAILLAWIIALAIAGSLDSAIAGFVRSRGLESFMASHKHLRDVLKMPGEYGFTVAVMVLFLLHRLRWRASVLILLGTTLSGVNGFIKWMVGRIRPFKLFDEHDVARLAPFELHPFIGGLKGLFGGVKNLCFPSGHAALAFATAAAAAILLPRWRWVFYGFATIVAIERISENAHWLSDTVAAAALGIGGVWILRRLWWDRVVATAPALSDQLEANGSSTVPVPGDSRL